MKSKIVMSNSPSQMKRSNYQSLVKKIHQNLMKRYNNWCHREIKNKYNYNSISRLTYCSVVGDYPYQTLKAKNTWNYSRSAKSSNSLSVNSSNNLSRRVKSALVFKFKCSEFTSTTCSQQAQEIILESSSRKIMSNLQSLLEVNKISSTKNSSIISVWVLKFSAMIYGGKLFSNTWQRYPSKKINREIFYINCPLEYIRTINFS